MNVKRGKKRFLIGVPILSVYFAFFGGVRLWAMYETLGYVWGVGVVLVFIMLSVWFLIRTLGWIWEGFDLPSDKWMSLQEVEEKRDWVMIALYEDDAILRRKKLRAVAEGINPYDYETRRPNDWLHRNFPESEFNQNKPVSYNWWVEHRLHCLILTSVVSGMSAVAGLALLLLGPPPEYALHTYLSILSVFGLSLTAGLANLFLGSPYNS